MYYICCVPNCGSRRQDVKFHQFPKCEKRLESWLKSINCDKLRRLGVQELRNEYVCHKHFEKRFMTPKSRLLCNAYPTLFCALEISTGLPQITDVDTENEPGRDHTYTRKKHYDHSYCKPKPIIVSQQPSAYLDASDMPSTSTVLSSFEQTPQPEGSYCKTPRKLVKKRLLRNVNSLTPRCQLFYKEYKKAKRQNNYQSRAKKALVFSKEKSLEQLTKKMNPLTRTVLWMQVKLCTKNKKARRFTREEKLIALSIYKQGLKSYKFLQKIFILPSKSTLKKMISELNIDAGINPQIFEHMKQQVSKWDKRKKKCSVIYDEMAIESALTYTAHKDNIVGFVDLNGKINKFADHALVFMLRGAVFQLSTSTSTVLSSFEQTPQPEGVCHNDTDLNHSSHQIEVINSNTTTSPISILVQSMVQQLCTLIEKDPNRADQLYKTICEKLYSMNLIDDSYAMGEFEMMRSQYQWALVQLEVVANGSQPLPISLPSTWPKIQSSGLERSRYHKDFEELCFIAGGGFGKVFVALNKLDGVKYAVKKVNIRSTSVDTIMNHLDEVKTLASLNHPNIVNYKAAWFEPMIGTVKKKRVPDMDMDGFVDITNVGINVSSSTFSNIMASFKTHNSKELIKSRSQSDFEISFRNSNSLDTDSISEDESESYGTDEDTPSLRHENAVCKWPGLYEKHSRVNLKGATLYIQMSLCQQTLKQWLEDRNRRLSAMRKNSIDSELHHSDSNDSLPPGSPVLKDTQSGYPPSWNYVDVVIDMFTKLVRGLHYIHSRGIIHHDIKPSNVFVAHGDNGLELLLGDFGLACPLQRAHTGLGTQLYAAPEQLEGHCDPKSDMYSLGIILLEMVEVFVTDMERVKTIEDLRKGQIPAHLTVSHPKIAHIIGKLVQRRPTKRLDTSQLLEELKLLHENKDEIIRSLREELAAKDDEIMKLKMMLANLHILK